MGLCSLIPAHSDITLTSWWLGTRAQTRFEWTWVSFHPRTEGSAGYGAAQCLCWVMPLLAWGQAGGWTWRTGLMQSTPRVHQPVQAQWEAQTDAGSKESFAAMWLFQPALSHMPKLRAITESRWLTGDLEMGFCPRHLQSHPAQKRTIGCFKVFK